ncbi:uncharacterized protein LOC8266470 [Ricinus communis]|uniref:Uncharacterized protein n=1 Tax=Ricinus communis TaxID=3988 RepID=B9RCB4_RICCO|nr:uncharacterized protein LOC8266470 [Ricinus communis]EEF51185.1 conserved hypothetical protein [Ricinus communis]|eukprot:XP_002509798.1 uncharacterized protein LOC8266470 [Ricinus communis]
MGKKGGIKKPPYTPTPSHTSISLRQETTGRIQAKGATVRNPKSFLKLEHLQNLSLWTAREASIPSLSAFFGRQLAAAGEALGFPSDPALFPCQRCETLLQPGLNCTVRIAKTLAKSRRRHKKPNTSMQNNVVYNCHFCSHQNLKRGSTKGYMKEICPSKPKQKPSARSKPSKPMPEKSVSLEDVSEIKDEMVNMDEIALPPLFGDTCITNSSPTPLVKSGATLLDAKRRKRNRSGAKRSEESDNTNAAKDGERTGNASSKRKRKSWTSLKEIAESKEHDSTQNVANLAIPFFI